MNEYDKAIEDFTRAIALKPQNEDYYNNRGLNYFYQREYEKAIADFTKSIELNSENSSAFCNRGDAYLKINEYDKAIFDLEKAVELDHNDEEASELLNQANNLKSKNQLRETLDNGSSNKSKNTGEILGELNSLIGLDKVKSDVAQLINFLKVQKMREERGMATQPISRHLVFSGNPGTGKTTVARIIAEVYKSLGILSKGHFIETDRAGLVGRYLGETAQKVKEVVDEALGCVDINQLNYSM